MESSASNEKLITIDSIDNDNLPNNHIDTSKYYDNKTFKRKLFITYVFFINRFLFFGDKVFNIALDMGFRRIAGLIGKRILKIS